MKKRILAALLALGCALLNQYDAKQLAETDPARRAAPVSYTHLTFCVWERYTSIEV